jgi:sugar phosphate isomerase/epimerase
MKPWIMFTKHLEGYDLDQVMNALQQAGVEGADLCVRPGYPVNPENAAVELPRAAERFKQEGLCIPLVTAPGDMTEPDGDHVQALFEACGAAGVQFIKLGYWTMEDDGYWPTIDRCRSKLEGFAKHAEKSGVKAIVHNHLGATMGLNSSSVMNLVKDFDPAHVGVFADVGHLSIVGEPYPMALDIVKDYMVAVAFKDLVRRRIQKDDRFEWTMNVVPMSQGYVDFPLVMEVLRKTRFQGPISFHCEYNWMPPESVVDQCRIDTRYIGSLMEQK